jgi:hypothetical protein
MDISHSYPRYTARRSCFAKRFSKTDSTPPQNLLHQHSHSRSCHSRSQSPAKRTLNLLTLDIPTYGLSLKGKQPLEEVLSLTIFVLIALALPIAPLYMLYERFMGGESFIKLV